MTTKRAIEFLESMSNSQFAPIAKIIKDADEALNAAACPLGNDEHGEYSMAERIEGLSLSRNYAWRQLDAMRQKYLPVPTVINPSQPAPHDPQPPSDPASAPQA